MGKKKCRDFIRKCISFLFQKMASCFHEDLPPCDGSMKPHKRGTSAQHSSSSLASQYLKELQTLEICEQAWWSLIVFCYMTFWGLRWGERLQVKVQASKPREIPSLNVSHYIKIPSLALTGVAKWIEHRPANQRVAGLIPSLGNVPELQARSPVGGVRESATHWCFSLSPSPPFCLKINKQNL